MNEQTGAITVAEVRFSNIARAVSYATATYNNVSSPGSFYTVT